MEVGKRTIERFSKEVTCTIKPGRWKEWGKDYSSQKGQLAGISKVGQRRAVFSSKKWKAVSSIKNQ